MNNSNYSNVIAPQIIKEARDAIFNTFREKGYINSTSYNPIKQIEDGSTEICTWISMEVMDYLKLHKPNEINVYAPLYSSIFTVLVGMALTKEWANDNTKNIASTFYSMMRGVKIETFDEYLIKIIGIKYNSKEYIELLSLIKNIYIEKWLYINEEAKRQGLCTQPMFVIDSLKIMLSVGVQIEKKRLGIS